MKATSGFDWWVGKIDDVRIYNRALAASEVQQLYQLNNAVTIVRVGAAVSYFNQGYDSLDVKDSKWAATGGAVLGEGLFGQSKPSYVFVLPPPTDGSASLSSITVSIIGNGGAVFTAYPYIGTNREAALPHGVATTNYTFSGNAAQQLITNVNGETALVVTIDASPLQYYYDLQQIVVTYQFSGVGVTLLEAFQQTQGGADAMNQFNADVGQFWPTGKNLTQSSFETAIEQGVACALSVDDADAPASFLDGLTSLYSDLNDFQNFVNAVSGIADWEEFWISYNGGGISQALQDAYSSLYTLESDWVLAIGNGTISCGQAGTINSDITAAENNVIAVSNTLHNTVHYLNNSFLIPNIDSANAEIAIASLSPLMQFSPTTANELPNSYLSGLWSALEWQRGLLPKTLNVGVSGVSSAYILTSPADLNGLQGGTTPLTFCFSPGSTVGVTAPGSASGQAFLKWQLNGVDYSSSAATTVTMANNYTLTAVYGTSPSHPVLSVYPINISQTVTQGQNSLSQSFNVWNSGTGAMSYTITTNQPWLSVSPTNGTSSGQQNAIQVNCNTENLPAGIYTGTVTITAPGASDSPQSVSVSVTNLALSCSYSITPTAMNFGSVGGSNSVSVLANYTNCSWGAVSGADFITITSGSGGPGNGIVSYTVAINYDAAPRIGTITIAGQTFTVTQASGDIVGDGIPNWWRAQYFGGNGATTGNLSCATCDADGTGQNNLFKYVAGLDPTNPASVFVLSVASVSNQFQAMSLNFSPLGLLRTYTPQFSTNLTGGVWLPLTTYTSVLTNGSQVTITDTNPIPPHEFYRMEITYPSSTSVADSAADPAYTNGWYGGSNGGAGFGPWTLTQTAPNGSSNGFFIGSSTNNAFGTSPGIDTDGESWGIYANNGNDATAYRAFIGGSLQVGQSLLISMRNGFINSGDSVGFVLRNGDSSSNANDYTNGARLLFEYIGFSSSNSYQVVDSGGAQYVGVGYTGTGLNLVFTLGTNDTYTLQVFDNATGNLDTIVNGVLGGTPGSTLDSIALYNQNAGSGGQYDAFFNSLQIIGP
jgi:hypothetical protein